MGEKSTVRRLLRWVGVWGFVVAQPLFSLFSRQLDFLHSHHVNSSDLILLATGWSLLPPLGGWMVESAFYPWKIVQQWIHRGVLGVSVSILVLMALHDRIPSRPLLFLLLGVVALVSWVSGTKTIRGVFTLSGVLALSFPLLFLYATIPQLKTDDAGFDWQPAQVRSEHSLLLIVLDELPLTSLLKSDGTLDSVRFPGFAALASDSVYYPNATTVSRATNYAIPAILTGQFPNVEGPPILRNYPVNLMTTLGKDRRIKVSGSLTHLCPPGQCGTESNSVSWIALNLDILVLYPHMILPKSLRRHLPDISSSWRDFAGSLRSVDNRNHPRIVTDGFTESFQNETDPFFWGIHFLLPHVPWRYLPDSLEYDPLGRVVGTGFNPAVGEWLKDPDMVELGLRRHLLQIGFADELLGRLVSGLKEAGRWDSTLVILTADHGGAFEPGEPRRTEAEKQYAEVLNIPLFVKYPGSQKASEDDRFVQTVDIMATVAEVLEFEPKVPLEGVSLLQPGERPKPRVWSSNMKNLGEEAAIDPGQIQSTRQRIVERNGRSMGNGSWEKVWTTDLPEGWAGRPLGDIPSRKGERIKYELFLPSILESVDLDHPFRPALIRSEVKRPQRTGQPLPITVVVNGRVAARASCWSRRNRVEICEAMVPPGFFATGKNRVRLFAYEETPEGPQLIRSSSAIRKSMTWVGQGAGAKVVSENGAERRLIPGGNQGSVRLYTSHKRWYVKGWTARRSNGEIPPGVAIFVNRHFIRTCPVNRKPPFGKAKQNPRWSKAGYQCEIPWSEVDKNGKESIHVMALYEDDAVMLLRDTWVPWGHK